jgi:uncharacterized protein YpuA (DUF1002 family)
MDPLLSSAITTVGGGIAFKLIALWERRQQRQEAREDREEQRQAATRIEKKLDVNTKLTQETRADASNAFNVANDVNTKFLKIHARLDRHDEQLAALARR